jgi:hypothetical protein
LFCRIHQGKVIIKVVLSLLYIYDNNDKTVFSTISSHQLSKERCSLQLRVVEFKKWRIDFKKQDALIFIFYFQKKEKEKTMPVTIFVSFRVNLIYVIRECLCRSLKL